MPHWTFYVALFLIGMIGSCLGGLFSGGVSLIGVGGMMLLGVPAQLTMPTYFAGSLLGRIGHFRTYMKADKIVWRLVLPLSVATFTGSLVGSYFLLHLSDGAIHQIINGVLLLLAPLGLLKTRLGIERIVVSRQRELLGFVAYFLVAAWTSFFAAWAGLLMLYVYLIFFGLTILEIKGTDSIPGTFLAIGATLVFLRAGSFNMDYLLAFSPGMIVGTIIGARLALWFGDARLQILVRLSVMIVALKVIMEAKFLRPILSLFFGIFASDA